ncbi:MAG: hypothetical protein HOE88_02700 [Flavobacteriales bacterium]|jgi:hypothetical protein|nr:hypothetical protein [Flavobacteriales bacterium]MBT3572401.1 hypothetical protein [Flavobacteriales bacterium]MBT3678270.1 hypothetical protein [Flavobacteriales bacterium]MBT3739632.1 hypothetical protein [Flavobacteriales bacterium]MBT4102277.1 hypothetical protein [Flavobacteriales bacterium]
MKKLPDKPANNAIMQGAFLLSLAFPLMFGGPAMYFWIGAPALADGQWLTPALCILAMASGVVIAFSGIKTILRGIFED